MNENSTSSGKLPPLMDIAVRPKKSNARRTKFEKRYKDSRGRLLEIFKPNEEMTKEEMLDVYGPEDPRVYHAAYQKAPEGRKDITQENWTLIEEIDKNGGVLPGDTEERELYPSQRAHLDWLAINGPHADSFHILGPPGTGKTLAPCAAVVLMHIRQQLRRNLEGKIAYCTSKSHHLSAKMRQGDDRRRHLLRAPPYDMSEKDWAKIYNKLRKTNPAFMKISFSRAAFMELLTEPVSSVEEAYALLQKSLTSRGLPFTRDHETLVMIATILGREGKLVRGPKKQWELLPMPAPPQTDDEQREALSGDVGLVIPENYPVYARAATGVSTAEMKDARLALDVSTLFTSARQIRSYGDVLHKDLDAVVVDEAGRNEAMRFIEPTYTASGKTRTPRVYGASSQRYKNQSWEKESPGVSWAEAIRMQMLFDLGVQFGPSAKAEHYPAETEEAIDQFMKMIFAKLKLYSKLQIPQPAERNTVAVVHGKLIDKVTEGLREQYPTHMNADVRPYYGDEDEKGALEDWFDTPRDGPNVLVLPASEKLSLHLGSIRRLAIGTRVTADALFHLAGRVAHGQGDMKKDDRQLLTMQQFADSNLRVTPFTVFNHGQDLGEAQFAWSNGQILMSEEGYAKDRKITKGKASRFNASQIPSTARRTRGDPLPIKVGQGISLFTRNENGQRVLKESLQPQTQNQRTAAVPSPNNVSYRPGGAAPTSGMVQEWCREVGGEGIYGNYSAALKMAANSAHERNENPRLVVLRKVAQLRERSARYNSGG